MNRLPKQQYISFDIFDTLIKRSVACPTDLFYYVEEYCAYNYIKIPSGFAKNRIEAENNARLKKGREVTFEEIYAELKPIYGEHTSELQKIELFLELNGCRANQKMTEYMTECIQAGKTVILISDMYLSSAFISRMLEHCGIHGYKKIYVSCEQGCSKHSGLLYNKVIEDLNIKNDMLFHIGDNRKGDFLIPISQGIHAYKIPNLQKKLCRVPKQFNNIKDGLIFKTISASIENCLQNKQEIYQLGFKTFGPILTGFVLWLKTQLERDGIKDVYFMSRDGYMLKNAFDTIKMPHVKTHYLYCSRRSFTVPLLWKHTSLKDIFHNITFGRTFSLSTFIMRIGLVPEDYIEEARECGLDLNTEFTADMFIQNSQSVYFYERIKGKAICNSRNEYNALLSYLSSFEMDKRIGVVDIGYNGTMQNALEQIIKEADLDIKVTGYYVSVSPDSDIINHNEICAYGYLRQKGKNEEIMKNIPAHMFEIMFLAQHGSVERFIYKNGNCVPQFYEYEYSDRDIHKIIEFQNGALRFVKEYISSFTSNALPVNPYVAIYNYERMLITPTSKEVRFWGDFVILDGTYFSIAKPKHLLYYFLHWHELEHDYKQNVWGIGFLYRLIKLPIPYYQLIQCAKEIVHFLKSRQIHLIGKKIE